jgi:serine/threonine protein kinase/formylglycine-generating enzyme required for sulfatase activity
LKEHLPKQQHLRSSEASDPRIDAALQEYFEQLDGGEAIEREAFLARYPEIANTLRNFIAAEEELRKLAGDKASRESAGITTQSFAAQDQETVPPESRSKISPGTAGSGLQGQFGRYQIIRAVGKGAMGTVYLAQDTQLKRYVAIKTPHFEDDPTGELLKRFYREAEAAATLRHANICPVHDVGEIDGKHFISMAYIDGRPLSDLIKSGKAQSERHIVIAVHKLARALQQAHDRGIVHRDLKPANIMVDNQGEPLVMDFGLARKRRADGEASLTHSGVLLGSPAYMSPEQIEGDPDSVGPASDQYSLGVVLYEMLTGQLPFRGSVVNVLAQIITKGPIPPSELRAGLDPRIAAVCLRMMTKKASDRFPSMKAVADQLAAIVKNPAAAPTAAEKSPAPSRLPAAAPSSVGAGASEIRESARQKALTESDLTSLEELVRKCLRRRDYDQAIQIVERIPEKRRNTALQTLLEKASEKVDEIAFLICEIDEADRLNDGSTALRKAEELLKIKPGHGRARAIHEKYSGDGEGAAFRIGSLFQFNKRWSEGGWIPWSALAFGLAVFAGVLGVIVIYLGKTAIVLDVRDADIKVEFTDQGKAITITGPNIEKLTVQPGQQRLKITYSGLETTTESFELRKGQERRVKVLLVDKNVAAEIDNQPLKLSPGSGKDSHIGNLISKSLELGAARIGANLQPKREERSTDEPSTFAGTHAGQTRMDNGLKTILVWIPPGEFTMGSADDDRFHRANEKQVKVSLSRGFWLGQHEVTQADWQKVMQTTPWIGNPSVHVGDNYPATLVSWRDAATFCEKLTNQERSAERLPAGWQYTLPTEAEWEYACRAGSTSRFSFGDDQRDIAGYAWKKGDDFAHPVGQKRPNSWALYDMHGNVSEWCRDWFTLSAAGGSDPRGPSQGARRVYRGGNWQHVARSCRSAVRDEGDPSLRNDWLGFRVACDVASAADVARFKFKEPPKESKTRSNPAEYAPPQIFNGDWESQHDEIAQTNENIATAEIHFGDPSWTDYDFQARIRRDKSRGFFGIGYRCLDRSNRHLFLPSYDQNKHSVVDIMKDGISSRPYTEDRSLNNNHWYLVRIKVRGNHFEAYLDNEKIFEYTNDGPLRGGVMLTCRYSACRFRDIKVTDPNNNVLWSGLPYGAQGRGK